MVKTQDSCIYNLGILTRQHGHIAKVPWPSSSKPHHKLLFEQFLTSWEDTTEHKQINTIGGTNLGFPRSLGLSTIWHPHQFLSGPWFLPFSFFLEYSCKSHKCRENAELSWLSMIPHPIQFLVDITISSQKFRISQRNLPSHLVIKLQSCRQLFV